MIKTLIKSFFKYLRLINFTKEGGDGSGKRIELEVQEEVVQEVV